MAKATVTEVIEPMEDRVSKAGKTYKAMKVELEIEGGELVKVLSFNQVDLGEVVEVKQNDAGYWNIDAPRKNQVDLSPVLDELKKVHEKLDKLLLLSPKGKDFAKTVRDGLDDVYDVPED